MAAYARLKNEFTEDEKFHNLMTWLNQVYSNLSTINTLLTGTDTVGIWW